MATVKQRRGLKGLEQRRREGMRMLARGVAPAEVARTLQVCRRIASNWAQSQANDAQAWRRKQLARPAGLSAVEKSPLSTRLVSGAVAYGFPTEPWTLAGIGALLEVACGRVYGTTQVWRLPRGLGLSNQRLTGHAIQRGAPVIPT
jgi:transposase